MNFNNLNKIGLFLSSIFIFSGCVSSFNESDKTEVAVVNNITNLKEITADGFYQNDIIGLKKEMTLPAYVGPSMGLSESEYILAKYAEKNLLFANYGIKDRIYLLTGSKSVDEKDAIAKSYGFNNFEHMFEYLFYYYNNKDKYELNYALKFLKSNDLISDLGIFSKQNIDAETDKLIALTYANYFDFEKTDNLELQKEWLFVIDGKKVAFTKNDYKPYAFILTLIKELINHKNSNGVQLYGF